MSAWTFERPTEPGWYLFHGHPDAQRNGIFGDAKTEFVGVTRIGLAEQRPLLFSGPGVCGPKAAIGMWMQIDPAPNQTWPWENFEVVHLTAAPPP